MFYHVSTYVIQEIQKQVKKLRDTLVKNVQLPPCTDLFQKAVALPCAHKAHWYIYEKFPISIEFIYWHWRFNCNHN